MTDVRRRWACIWLSLGAMLVVASVAILLLRNAFLNGYAKAKLEQAFMQAFPGHILLLGHLDYYFAANRLSAQSATLIGPTERLKTGPISLTGIHWLPVLRKSGSFPKFLAQASLAATNIEGEFSQSKYRFRFARLKASVPHSELVAEGAELRPSMSDEKFFAAHEFRTTRFHIVIPECRVSGLVFYELFQGKSYRARSIHLSEPTFDALVNRDKSPSPFINSPRMINEVLTAIAQPLQVDSLVVTNGYITYREQLIAGAAPGVLTFGAVNLSIDTIANRAEAASAIKLRAQSKFMNAGILTLAISMPVASRDFSIHYSGTLGVMDLTLLNAFLEASEQIRVKSGSTQESAFDIEVSSGQARGNVRAAYSNLDIAVVDKITGSEKGLENRLNSLIANVFKIRKGNAPDASGAMREGNVNYKRGPEDEFLQFLWFALRTGVLDIISH